MQATGGGGKQPRQPIASKNLKKVQVLNSVMCGRSGGSTVKQMTAAWNRHGRRKVPNETKRGWLKKNKRATDARGRLLHHMHPGTVAL